MKRPRSKHTYFNVEHNRLRCENGADTKVFPVAASSVAATGRIPSYRLE